jgi:hypothetical protein
MITFSGFSQNIVVSTLVILWTLGESVTGLLVANSSIKSRDPVFDSPAHEAVHVLYSSSK